MRSRTLRACSIRVRLLAVHRHRIAPPHLVAALAAHRLNVDLLIGVGVDELERRLQNVRVERARKSLVAADHNQQHALLRPRDKQRMAQVPGRFVEDVDAPRQRFQHAGDHPRIRPGRQRTLLCAAQFRRRHHLHGLGDLPRVLHAANAPP